jgi:hypothetical protein
LRNERRRYPLRGLPLWPTLMRAALNAETFTGNFIAGARKDLSAGTVQKIFSHPEPPFVSRIM